MSATTPQDSPNPRDFLANWTASRGNLRNFLETQALAPLDEESQRTAGEAAPPQLEEFGLELEDFASGVDSVTGSYDAAGAQRITAQDPDVPVDVGAAAFFDVDNTLIQGSSLVEFAFGLARKRYFRLSEILPIAWKQLKFRVSGSENAKDVAAGRAQALEFVKGRSVDELVDLCERSWTPRSPAAPTPAPRSSRRCTQPPASRYGW